MNRASLPPVQNLASDDVALHSLLAELSLEEKVQLLTGRNFWTTWPMERIGLRRILVSDGPSGVRGEVWDERDPSLNLPSATALSSTWDVSVARRYGNASAVEARRKGVDVVLGPTINLHRSPLGGRHFEAFSEDPLLTADLAASYVAGVQENGVGATPKHYVANDFETDRFTVDVVVSDRALRELYLAAFEKAITESGAWLVMSAYNSVNGVTATENLLLETPLNSEWCFDGVVISDWTAVRSVESANASQDLVMPGPDGPWGEALVAAVRTGAVEESAVDRKVLRLLRLAARVGALEGFEPASAGITRSEDGVAFAREAASAGMVLVENDGELPWNPASIGSIAVIGQNARFARSQGGGSATVVPERVVTPLDGIMRAFPGSSISYSVGAVVQEGIAELPLDRITNPVTGTSGMHVSFRDSTGTEIFAEDRFATALVWFGGDAPIARCNSVTLKTRYLPETTGEILVGFAAVGNGRIIVDGQLRREATLTAQGMDLGAAFLAPPSVAVPVAVVAGVPIELAIEFDIVNSVPGLANALSIRVGIEPDMSDPEGLIVEAVEAALSADVALVVVGTNSAVESEGYDRDSLALPGRQDELVAAVLAANPRTVVVVNSGSPVEMPWRRDVQAVLLTYFAGQEFGNALADVITGAVEPGGRLPTTWPSVQADLPVFDVTPANGRIAYDEGIHIGYRAWLRKRIEPAYPFGYGRGYTSWTLDALELDSDQIREGDVVTASVTVSNTGKRVGKQVVQCYLSRADSSVDRPVRWLAGFAPVVVEAGNSATIDIEIPARAFAHWDSGWQYETGTFTLSVGTDVVTLPLDRSIELQ